MQIREATQEDIPGILNVLKASLGESSSKKTEVVWRYKHVDNPFGKSLVLVAEEKNIIIGVRAFMQWRWQMGSKVYSAFRAVDTATHPQHQGKGIFKKLTLEALSIGKQKGYHFVFNTPNDQSKPGYLKMGWKEVGKIYTHLIPVSPFYWNFKSIKNYSYHSINNRNDLLGNWHRDLVQKGKFFTPKSDEYLDWRYRNNPLQEYIVQATEKYFIAAYVKNQGKFKELRISELILLCPSYKYTCKKIIKGWAKEYGAHFISLSDPMNKNAIFRFKFSGNFGPVLTYRDLNNSSGENDAIKVDNWAYSLGDLEIF